MNRNDLIKYPRTRHIEGSRIQSSESHWLDRPIIPNQLCISIDQLFEG